MTMYPEVVFLHTQDPVTDDASRMQSQAYLAPECVCVSSYRILLLLFFVIVSAAVAFEQVRRRSVITLVLTPKAVIDMKYWQLNFLIVSIRGRLVSPLSRRLIFPLTVYGQCTVSVLIIAELARRHRWSRNFEPNFCQEI